VYVKLVHVVAFCVLCRHAFLPESEAADLVARTVYHRIIVVQQHVDDVVKSDAPIQKMQPNIIHQKSIHDHNNNNNNKKPSDDTCD
jgi:hypothetical protein